MHGKVNRDITNILFIFYQDQTAGQIMYCIRLNNIVKSRPNMNNCSSNEGMVVCHDSKDCHYCQQPAPRCKAHTAAWCGSYASTVLLCRQLVHKQAKKRMPVVCDIHTSDVQQIPGLPDFLSLKWKIKTVQCAVVVTYTVYFTYLESYYHNVVNDVIVIQNVNRRCRHATGTANNN